MDRIKTGMLAKSKAGHDSGKVYVIMDYDHAYVYLVDGEIRTLENPKKKKIKHVQIIRKRNNLRDITDVKIKRILKIWKKGREKK